MGAWGITSRESDAGLDTLALIETDILKPIGFKYFDVKSVMEFCKDRIIEDLRREYDPYLKSKKLTKKVFNELLQGNIDVMFPSHYSTAVLLVAECLVAFIEKGVFVINDYESKMDMEISKFIFTNSVLDELLQELRKLLNPTHDAYTSWLDDNIRQEWIKHVKMMCDSIETLKRGSGYE